MGDDNQFLKQKNKFCSDFMEHFDAKVNHILEMISNMQEHLQAQERNKGEEIRNDLSVANPQLHKLPLSPQEIEIELECLSLNPSSLSFNSQNTKLEDEGFVEVPIHTTVVELQFEESKSEAENQSCNTLKLDVSPQEIQLEHQVVTSTTNLEAMAKGVDFFIEETTKGEVQKVFDEMTELKMEVVCEFGMKETKLKVFDYLTERNFDPGGNAIFEVAGKFGNEWCSKNCSRIIFSHDSDQELYEGLFVGLFNPPHLCYYNNDDRFSNEDSYKMFNYYGCDRSVLGIFHQFPFYRSSYQGYVGYGKFKAEEKEGKLEFSDYRVKGVNPFLFSCSNMSGSSKEELFIEELVKIFVKSEVEEKRKKFSSLHTSWHQLKQDGRIGDTNMLILCQEITKAELGLIWATGTYDKANLNGPWQQEGKSNILWRMWEKKGIKILCIQSATVRPSSPNCCDDSLQPYIISMRVNHKIEEFNKWSSIMCDSLEAVELSTLCQKIPQHIRAWRQKTIELYILGKEKMSNRRNSLIIGKILVPAIYFRLAVIDFVGAAVEFNILYKWKLTTFGIHFLMIVVILLIFLHLLGEAEYNSCFKYMRYMHGLEVFCYIGSFWEDITPWPLNMLIEFGWLFLKPKIQNDKGLMRDLQELMACKYEFIYYFYGDCVVENHRLCVETKCIEEYARMRFLLHSLGIFFGVRTQLDAPKFDSGGGVNGSISPDLLDFLCEHYFYFNYSKTSSPTVKMTSPTTVIIKNLRLAILTIPCFMMLLMLLRAFKLLCRDKEYYSILVKLRCAMELYNLGKQNMATVRLPTVCIFGSASPSQTTNDFAKVQSSLGSVESTSKAFNLKIKPDFQATFTVVYKLKFAGLDGVEIEFDAHYVCNILDSAEANRLGLPCSCNTRACSTCAGNLVSAAADHSNGWLIDDVQMQDGCLLTSVSYLTSDSVIHTHTESDWIEKQSDFLDQPQFRHLSRGDTTLSRGEYCYGNGMGRKGGVGGGQFGYWARELVGLNSTLQLVLFN